MKTFLRLLTFAQPLGATISLFFLFIVLHTVFRIVNFTALIPVLQILFNGDLPDATTQRPAGFTLSDQYFIQVFQYHFSRILSEGGKQGALWFVCFLLLVSVLFANIFQFLAALMQARMRVRAVTNIRRQLFRNITLLDLQYFTRSRKGDIITRLTTDVQQIESTVVNSLKAVLKEPILILGFFIALFKISPQLTGYTLLLIPISGGLISFLSKRLKRRAKKVQESLSRMTSMLEGCPTNMMMTDVDFNLVYMNQVSTATLRTSLIPI